MATVTRVRDVIKQSTEVRYTVINDKGDASEVRHVSFEKQRNDLAQGLFIVRGYDANHNRDDTDVLVSYIQRGPHMSIQAPSEQTQLGIQLSLGERDELRIKQRFEDYIMPLIEHIAHENKLELHFDHRYEFDMLGIELRVDESSK
jgi:hypothetical protein